MYNNLFIKSYIDIFRNIVAIADNSDRSLNNVPIAKSNRFSHLLHDIEIVSVIIALGFGIKTSLSMDKESLDISRRPVMFHVKSAQHNFARKFSILVVAEKTISITWSGCVLNSIESNNKLKINFYMNVLWILWASL